MSCTLTTIVFFSNGIGARTSVLAFLKSRRLLVSVIQTCLFTLRRPCNEFEAPPTWYKRHYILSLMQRHNFDAFVETGTYLGLTSKIVALRNPTVMVDSIELDDDLFLRATRTLSIFYPRVKVWHGDSKKILKTILELRRGKRVLFWLDGHQSHGITSGGDLDSPLSDELAMIFDYLADEFQGCFILVDDVHEINNHPDYPNLDYILNLARLKGFDTKFHANMLMIYPNSIRP